MANGSEAEHQEHSPEPNVAIEQAVPPPLGLAANLLGHPQPAGRPGLEYSSVHDV
jgi:hypothetical protein